MCVTIRLSAGVMLDKKFLTFFHEGFKDCSVTTAESTEHMKLLIPIMTIDIYIYMHAN